MDDGLRRMLFAILAGLALAGLVVMVLAITLTPAGLQYWLYGALVIVIVALVAEVVLLVLTKPKEPKPEEQYGMSVDGNETR